MRTHRACVVGGIAALLASCGAFETDVAPSPDASSDSSTNDAASEAFDASAADADASDGAIAGAFFTDGFEDALTCPDWGVYNGAKTRVVTNPHAGVAGCMVCLDSDSFAILGRAVVARGAGGYELRAWARSEKESAGFQANLHFLLEDGGRADARDSGFVSPDAQWKPLTIAATTSAPIATLKIELIALGAKGSCTVFDDVVLIHAPQ
jgi:hypothetical protein